MTIKQPFAFFVDGVPIPKGSMMAVRNRIFPVNSAKLRKWERAIREAYTKQGGPLGNGSPITVTLEFYFNRPKSGKNRQFMTFRPDVDKLTRAVLDALSRLAYTDDKQIIRINASKHYVNVSNPLPGAKVTVQWD